VDFQDDHLQSTTSTGPTGWVDVRVSPRLFLEMQTGWLPTSEPAFVESQGGRTFILGGGARGLLAQTRFGDFYGILQPGVIRFSETGLDGGHAVGPRTHFALDMGISAEWRLYRRVVLRLDLDQELYTANGGDQPITPRSKVAATVGYRMADEPVAPRSVDIRERRFQLGAQGGYAAIPSWGDHRPVEGATAGGYVDYQVLSWMAAEAVVTGIGAELDSHSPWDGGRLVQMLAGAKLGRVARPFGLFFTVRGGINRFSSAYVGSNAGGNPYGPSRLPLIAAGVVVEYSRRGAWVARFEGAAAAVRYGQRTIERNGATVIQPPQPSQLTLQLSAGIGRRF
jgi:hypothetical protein